MFPSGKIYDSKLDSTHGVVFLAASKTRKILYGLIRGVGAGLVGYGIIMAIFTFWPLTKAEIGYQTASVETAEAQMQKATVEEARSLGIDPRFSIYIPKIDARANIIANVDVNSEREYRNALASGVAHARGTYFPGQGEKIYLFAHSTDSPANFAKYNAVFYLLNRLRSGDVVKIYFMDKVFLYSVDQSIETSAADISWLTRDFDQEVLLLQTCTPPGTSWRRLIVLLTPA